MGENNMINLYERVSTYTTTGTVGTDLFTIELLELIQRFRKKEHTQEFDFIIVVGTDAKHQQLIKVDSKLDLRRLDTGMEEIYHDVYIERLVLLPSHNGEQPKLFVIEELEGTLDYLETLKDYVSCDMVFGGEELLTRVEYVYTDGVDSEVLFDQELQSVYGYSDRRIAQVKNF